MKETVMFTRITVDRTNNISLCLGIPQASNYSLDYCIFYNSNLTHLCKEHELLSLIYCAIPLRWLSGVNYGGFPEKTVYNSPY